MTLRTYRAHIGSQAADVPIVRLDDDLAIALFVCVDHGVGFTERAGKELAQLLEPAGPEMVVSVATMGIPLAIEVSRSLGLDDYLILHKTPKIHLGDQVSEPLRSITTGSTQRLRMDPRRVEAVRGRRVAVVDDVVSTGGSVSAALRLLRRVGADPVAVGAFLTEGEQWQSAMGGDAERVRALGSLPLFRPDGAGGFSEQRASPL